MRESKAYERSHPWITFKLHLQEADYTFWVQLGQAQAKCREVSGVPLLPEVAEKLHRVYLGKGVLATTAIEGNTLTEEDVQKQIMGELDLPPSKKYLGQEIDNVITACTDMARRMLDSDDPLRLTVTEVKELNSAVLNALPLREGVFPGQIRDEQVRVGRYLAPPAEDCEYLLTKLCDWLRNESVFPEKVNGIASGILRAIFAHLYVAWIHPFGDGNGRTARLVEFQILLSSGVPTAAAHLLSNHYNLTREEYYRQLELASASGGDVMPFIQYALQGFIDGLNEQISYIREQQLRVHWNNYVYALFRDKEGDVNIRRRRLVLDLSDKGEPVPIPKIRHISPRIAEAYADRTDRTVRNDISVLSEMDLVSLTESGVQIKKESIILSKSLVT